MQEREKKSENSNNFFQSNFFIFITKWKAKRNTEDNDLNHFSPATRTNYLNSNFIHHYHYQNLNQSVKKIKIGEENYRKSVQINK